MKSKPVHFVMITFLLKEIKGYLPCIYWFQTHRCYLLWCMIGSLCQSRINHITTSWLPPSPKAAVKTWRISGLQIFHVENVGLFLILPRVWRWKCGVYVNWTGGGNLVELQVLLFEGRFFHSKLASPSCYPPRQLTVPASKIRGLRKTWFI